MNKDQIYRMAKAHKSQRLTWPAYEAEVMPVALVDEWGIYYLCPACMADRKPQPRMVLETTTRNTYCGREPHSEVIGRKVGFATHHPQLYSTDVVLGEVDSIEGCGQVTLRFWYCPDCANVFPAAVVARVSDYLFTSVLHDLKSEADKAAAVKAAAEGVAP